VLNNPASLAASAAVAAVSPDTPLPRTGNAQGALQILAKTDMQLTRGDPAETAAIQARVAAITTVGQAQAYANEVTARAKVAGASRNAPPPRPST
jgi:phospholipase C